MKNWFVDQTGTTLFIADGEGNTVAQIDLENENPFNHESANAKHLAHARLIASAPGFA